MDQVPGCPLYSIENKFGVGGPGAGPLGTSSLLHLHWRLYRLCNIVAPQPQALIVILRTFGGNFPSRPLDFTLFWGGPHIEWEPSRVAHGIMGRRFPDGGLLRYRKSVPQQLGDVIVVTNSPPIGHMRSQLTNHQVGIVLDVQAWSEKLY